MSILIATLESARARVAYYVDLLDKTAEHAEAGSNYRDVVTLLTERYGSRLIIDFTNGAYRMRLMGVTATCTAGSVNLLKAWLRAADRKIAKAAA